MIKYLLQRWLSFHLSFLPENCVQRNKQRPFLCSKIASDDAEYDGLDDLKIAVTVHDDDVASVVVTPEWMAMRPGDSHNCTVVLGSEPTANVTLPIEHAEFTFDPDMLVFTPLTWNEAVRVNIRASGEEFDDFEKNVIACTVESDDLYYEGLDTAGVTALVGNSLIFSSLNGTVTEGGGALYYHVTLVHRILFEHQPSHAVLPRHCRRWCLPMEQNRHRGGNFARTGDTVPRRRGRFCSLRHLLQRWREHP